MLARKTQGGQMANSMDSCSAQHQPCVPMRQLRRSSALASTPIARLQRGAMSLLLVLCTGHPAMAQSSVERPGFKSFRFDEDWTAMREPDMRTSFLDPLKWIPLNEAGSWYMTLGGELRARYEYSRNPVFGLDSPERNDYLLNRAFLFADVHFGPNFRTFVEFVSAYAPGWNGSPPPTQKDTLDVLQGFAEVRLPVTEGQLSVRAGRQEMSFGSSRLVSVRESPNVRRSFDGVRVIWNESKDFRVDAFAVQPVALQTGSFDDRRDQTQDFWGVYATTNVPAVPGLKADLYYMGLNRQDAQFAQGFATERRQTVGTRLFGSRENIDWNVEGAFQFGTFGSADIRAWAVSSDSGYTFSDRTWKPRLGLKADAFSGDGNLHNQSLGTFNSLFPKLPYFSDAGLVAPSNLLSLQPNLTLTVTPKVEFNLGWNPLWKQSKADAFYAPVLDPLPGTSGTQSRYIGQQWIASIEWFAAPSLTVGATYVHFDPGSVTKQAGGRPGEYFATWLQFQF
jgi:hypothetical protein